jgi:hypothetical protein
MYHVLVLIFSLTTGQPVGIAKAVGSNDFADAAACEASRVERMSDTQAVIESKPETAGKYLVADGKCFSDADIEKMQHPAPKVDERGA